MIDLVQRELELETTLEAAWRALTDPEWLSAWLAEEVELERVPGGAARFTVAGEHRDGWVEEVCPPEEDRDWARLSFWWSADGEPATRVELELTPVPDGRTRLRVTETRPLEMLDLVGVPLPGGRRSGYGPSLIAV